MSRKRKTQEKENSLLKEYKKHSNRKPPNKIVFHSIQNHLPPDNNENILFFDPMYGYEMGIATIVLQHIHHDLQTLKFSRTTHWARLKVKTEQKTE